MELRGAEKEDISDFDWLIDLWINQLRLLFSSDLLTIGRIKSNTLNILNGSIFSLFEEKLSFPICKTRFDQLQDKNT